MKDGYGRKNKFLSAIAIVLLIGILSFEGYFVYKAISTSKTEIEIQEDKKEETITPLLYEVTKEGSDNKMYLFGTIHIANEKDLKFPDYVMKAYNNSHYLACEFDIIAYELDQQKVIADATRMLYQDGTTIKDHLSEKAYNKLIKFLTEKKEYNSLYENYKLYFFLSLFTNIMANDAKISTTGVDKYFIEKAKEDNKTILEVESSDYQNDVLEKLSDGLYELMFNETIDNYKESVNEIKKSYDAWKKGNAKEILKYGAEDLEILDSYTEEQKKYIEEYNKLLVDDRNNEMLKKAIEYFNNNQDVFFMVGSLHIIGDSGLANQFKQNGFTVKQIKMQE